MKLPPFSSIVSESWTKAVSYASNNLEHYRDELIKALTSSDPEERSASVASFNEADDPSVHDLLIKLIDDPDEVVRREVLEYLENFGKKEDIKLVFDRIRNDIDLIFHKTTIFQNITGREKGTILDDDPVESIECEISNWEAYLKLNGYI